MRPKKRLGQNFLIDKGVAKRIVDAANLGPHDLVVEIGPGRGALTEGLAKKANRVIAVEIDKGLCQILRERFLESSDNLRIVEGDILNFDFKGLSKVVVLGNLPYYITSPIIVHLLEHKHHLDTILVTVQKEFAQRLCAKSGTKLYSPITCLVQYHTDVSTIFKISRNAFLPRPEVDSCLVRFKILSTPRVSVKDEGIFFRIIRASFNKRRKTILNSLSYADDLAMNKNEWQNLFRRCKIESTRRAETLQLCEFALLSNTYCQMIKGDV